MNKALIAENVAWGVRLGVRFGLGFSVLGIVPAAVRAVAGSDVWWHKGLPFVSLVGLYFVAGVIGGTILGLLRNLVPRWWGRRLIGVLIGIQFMFAVRLLIYGWGGWDPEELIVWSVIGAAWGSMMSFIPEADARQKWPPKSRSRMRF